jgi:hypothetical protein
MRTFAHRSALRAELRQSEYYLEAASIAFSMFRVTAPPVDTRFENASDLLILYVDNDEGATRTLR